MRFAIHAVLALTLFTSGCGSAISTGSLIGSANRSASALSSEPQTKEEFVKAVAERGVKLTEKQLQLIAQGRSVMPNGKFADRPAANLTAEENLRVHFEKHAHEFTPNIQTQEEYLQRAIDLAAGRRGRIVYYFDVTSFEKGYQSNVVRWNPETKEFTALRPDGAVTTLYLNYRLNGKRFVVVPKF